MPIIDMLAVKAFEDLIENIAREISAIDDKIRNLEDLNTNADTIEEKITGLKNDFSKIAQRVTEINPTLRCIRSYSGVMESVISGQSYTDATSAVLDDKSKISGEKSKQEQKLEEKKNEKERKEAEENNLYAQ